MFESFHTEKLSSIKTITNGTLVLEGNDDETATSSCKPIVILETPNIAQEESSNVVEQNRNPMALPVLGNASSKLFQVSFVDALLNQISTVTHTWSVERSQDHRDQGEQHFLFDESLV